jgi:hypothetical protein
MAVKGKKDQKGKDKQAGEKEKKAESKPKSKPVIRVSHPPAIRLPRG